MLILIEIILVFSILIIAFLIAIKKIPSSLNLKLIVIILIESIGFIPWLYGVFYEQQIVNRDWDSQFNLDIFGLNIDLTKELIIVIAFGLFVSTCIVSLLNISRSRKFIKSIIFSLRNMYLDPLENSGKNKSEKFPLLTLILIFLVIFIFICDIHLTWFINRLNLMMPHI